MAKIDRAAVVWEALELLDEVGLDGVSTRAVARRLGVEQPSLYWHFKNKQELLAAMAAAALQRHDELPLPQVGDDWKSWFLENYRSFRGALLAHRDGARLHAGSVPDGASRERLLQKFAFLIEAGVAEQDAITGMLAASRFTVGSALEQQADPDADRASPEVVEQPVAPTHEQAFEAGLLMLLTGLEGSTTTATARRL
ncbi:MULTISPECIES: TetR/AcrR family transcriptional regulator C-terminal domain-containing protein [unclassified Frondihabitans]|uniref:TetR/AcrR family transcriptional regulator C-terminal domain-containing protein n=1 Tax=unclassified Frondihabitans TaxID=2626248 RepID=UPI000F50C4DC|nr:MULTISPECIES: TetR/AcrR family transcriptional regulator C-terminal domain-containing protein [unclassified Frondihabitans]RPE78626.1 TetR family transcriptional regulator [Frondihabitans sp. PhB153]RPF08907.1 TetR family transcriptional regulator [Frondihabitans sp. PhB161]